MSGELNSYLAGGVLNLATALLLIRGIYYPVTRERGFVFSFLAFSSVTYFLLRFITDVELSIGAGFGLFAIFSILRYRTEAMPAREMTYLFTVIGLAVMNSFLRTGDDLTRLLIANGVIALLLFALEREWGFRFEASKVVIYERMSLIGEANRAALIDDLRTRTGLPVKRVAIGRIDFLRDTAEVTIYYDEPRHAAKRAAEHEPAGAVVARPESRAATAPHVHSS